MVFLLCVMVASHGAKQSCILRQDLLLHGIADIVQQARMVLFECHDIVTATSYDLAGHLFLRPHRIHCDGAMLDAQQVEKTRDLRDLIALFRYAQLPSTSCASLAKAVMTCLAR